MENHLTAGPLQISGADKVAKEEPNHVGRPTKYNAEVFQIAEAYLKNYNTEYGHAIPSIAGLAFVLGVSRSTIYEWEKGEKSKAFSYTLSQLATYQEFQLLNGGLLGDFNPAITKLALANHGYSDKQEVETTSKPINPINIIVKSE